MIVPHPFETLGRERLHQLAEEKIGELVAKASMSTLPRQIKPAGTKL